MGIFFDPVLGCNFRCRMCYFSNEEKRKTMKGSFREEDLPKLAGAFFHRALKLQIGCGAEPSLFRHNKKIIELAKEKKIPYVSMTTNANLFSEEDWRNFIKAGLDEVTISLHGVTQTSYEYFMVGGSFPLFHKAMETLTRMKKQYPQFKIRINYTINKDNLEELSGFFSVFGNYKIDILQLRPIQRIGESEYADFSWNEIYETYDRIVQKIKDECEQRNIICLAPAKMDLIKTDNVDSIVFENTYCYISPRCVWKKDFDLNNDTFESYSEKIHLGRKLFKNIFKSRKQFESSKNQLNYEVY